MREEHEDESVAGPDGWKILGNYKMISPTGQIYLKVINFPVPDDCSFAGESMWVVKKDGTDLEGTGWLDNIPAFSEVVDAGDLISYAGGTASRKPEFVKLLKKDARYE
jgi:hypothetical protein